MEAEEEGLEEAAGEEVEDEGEPKGMVAEDVGEGEPGDVEDAHGRGHGQEHAAGAGEADVDAVPQEGHDGQ